MDKERKTELWITLAAMACPMITAYTGIPIEPAAIAAGIGGVYALCRTVLKIVKAIKDKKKE